MYTVKFVYLDGQDIDIQVHPEKLDGFIKSVNTSEVYWGNEDKENGVWLNMSKVRYVQFNTSKGPAQVELKTDADNKEIKDQDGVETRKKKS